MRKRLKKILAPNAAEPTRRNPGRKIKAKPKRVPGTRSKTYIPGWVA